MATSTPSTRNPLAGPGFFLGFAMGGFFDGILLHQILQWHHLLSNVNAVQDMRWQVMADGVFHALMYLIAGVALCQLWRRRAATAQPRAGRTLWALALIGFGCWHMLDGVVSHWVTGIHRIKIDSPQPLVWDLVWFFGFGLLPALLGWRALRHSNNDRGNDSGNDSGNSGVQMANHTAAGAHDGTHHGSSERGAARLSDSPRTRPGRTAAVALAASAVLAGVVALGPAGPDDQVTVLFAPGVTPGQAFNALARLDARVLWVDQAGGLWAVALQRPDDARRLYRDGALLVSRSSMALGCFSWFKAAQAPGTAPARG
jgi:uncharacterized membrane protein